MRTKSARMRRRRLRSGDFGSSRMLKHGCRILGMRLGPSPHAAAWRLATDRALYVRIAVLILAAVCVQIARFTGLGCIGLLSMEYLLEHVHQLTSRTALLETAWYCPGCTQSHTYEAEKSPWLGQGPGPGATNVVKTAQSLRMQIPAARAAQTHAHTNNTHTHASASDATAHLTSASSSCQVYQRRLSALAVRRSIWMASHGQEHTEHKMSCEHILHVPYFTGLFWSPKRGLSTKSRESTKQPPALLCGVLSYRS
jgi:hypothetical protein